MKSSNSKVPIAMEFNPSNFSASLVPAPKCLTCGTPMSPHSSTHWVCNTEDCGNKGKPEHTGVYPMFPVEKPMNRNHPDFPGLLETMLVPTDTWDTCGAPPQAINMVKEATKEGIPTGIAKHPTLGWFVIQSGQGPMIVWSEVDETHKEGKFSMGGEKRIV